VGPGACFTWLHLAKDDLDAIERVDFRAQYTMDPVHGGRFVSRQLCIDDNALPCIELLRGLFFAFSPYG
jgi:hypothetical protein